MLDEHYNEARESNESPIQYAETSYKVLSTTKWASFLEVIPKTGRKHQIRAHLSQVLNGMPFDYVVGESNMFLAPIMGDYKYGPGLSKHSKNPYRSISSIPMHLHLRQLVIPVRLFYVLITET